MKNYKNIYCRSLRAIIMLAFISLTCSSFGMISSNDLRASYGFVDFDLEGEYLMCQDTSDQEAYKVVDVISVR